jgi:N-acyl-D-aspartate/D-glutamate deacylase
MFDLVIRNGVLYDGSGLPGWRGDLAIRDGRIAALGRVAGRGAREIDAAGRAVAPGFIDPHTHFDAQLCWDPWATPALEHGVTTVVPGNCSLTLAPLRAAQRDRLVRMYRQIEEMPRSAFEDGIDWTWETFPGYLAALRGRLGINVAPLVGHSAIRMWVMGDDAHARTARPDELAAMQAVLREALAAGAVGLSTSYVDIDENFAPVPSRFADAEEIDALCAVLGERGRMLQIVHEFYDAELTLARIDVLAELSLRHGIPTTLSPLFESRANPDLPERVIARVAEQMRRGARVWPQVQTRPIDISFSLDQRSLLFFRFPTWLMVLSLPLAQREAALRNPGTRERLVNELEGPSDFAALRLDFGRLVVRHAERESNRALVGRTLGEIARERGSTPANVLIDLSLEDGLRTAFLAESLGHDDAARVGWMLAHPCVHVGASDGGAHVASFATYGDTGHLFRRFVRETGALSLEAAIKKITLDTATIWGIPERGALRAGWAADVVVFDPERVDRGPELPARDLPGDGFRYVRPSVGVDTVIVNGAVGWSRDGGYTEARTGVVAL